MKALGFTRYTEWWSYKIVPFLSVGYVTILLTGIDFLFGLKQLLILFLATVVGAVYVSIINDLTDIKEDAIANKKNRMAGLSIPTKIFLVSFCILVGIFFGYFLSGDFLSLLFYILAWVVFSLYSIPPIRLKKRGLWGVFCDASGAHLFPTLYVITFLYYQSGLKFQTWWLICAGLWALFYGLRGILWHQFHDRGNDLRSSTTTFATTVSPNNFTIWERIIFGIEITAFLFFLSPLNKLLLVAAVLIYVVLFMIRKFAFKYATVFILEPQNQNYQLIMNDYYLVIFPLSLLLFITFAYKLGFLLLLFHLLLFSGKILFVLKDLFIFLKQITIKV